jgi:hypothetical protein
VLREQVLVFLQIHLQAPLVVPPLQQELQPLVVLPQLVLLALEV